MATPARALAPGTRSKRTMSEPSEIAASAPFGARRGAPVRLNA